MKDACGKVIGLSAGSTIFDVDSPDNDEMQQGAAALRNGDISRALSHFQTVTAHASSNAEAGIYTENLRVLNHRLDYIAIGLGVTSGRIGSFRDSLQGAYLAQVAYNQSAPQRNLPSLVLIIANSGANPANANWVAQQILALKKANSRVMGVVGWTISSDSVNANAILAHQPTENDNVFMLSPSATSRNLSDTPDFLRTILSDIDQANYLTNYAYDALNYRKIAILYTSDDNFTLNLYASFKDAFTKKNGASVVSEQPYSLGNESSLHTALSKALQSHPDGIYFAGFAADVGPLLSSSQIKKLPPRFKILSGSALAVLSDYPANLQNLDRLVFTSFASQDEWNFLHHEQLPIVSTFLSSYQSTFPSGVMNTNVMLTYDAINVFLQGYQMALANGGTDTCLPCALQKAFHTMNGAQAWQGVSGQIAFDSRSTEPIDKVILINVIENGTTKTIDYRGCFLVDRTDCRD
jgi:ABC-type branched-subunit amino acid transport system substrate-binding protein